MIQNIVKANQPGKAPLEFQPFFIPKGLMPPAYYKDRLEPFNRARFVSRWSGKFTAEKLRILAAVNELSNATVEKLTEILSSIGIKFEYISDRELVSGLLEKYEYDAAFGSWVADADKNESFVKMVEGMVAATSLCSKELEEFGKQMAELRRNQGSKREEKFSEIFAGFEKQYVVAPLFRTWTPILVSKHITLPPSQFGFYFDLLEVKKHAFGSAEKEGGMIPMP